MADCEMVECEICNRIFDENVWTSYLEFSGWAEGKKSRGFIYDVEHECICCRCSESLNRSIVVTINRLKAKR